MKKTLFLIIIISMTYGACWNSDNDNPSCPEQKMPDPTKETNFVACKIDGKVWRDQPLKWWSPLSAELDYANTPFYPQSATIIAAKRIEKEGCDTIYDHFVIDWRYNKIGDNKIDMGNFTQHSTSLIKKKKDIRLI